MKLTTTIFLLVPILWMCGKKENKSVEKITRPVKYGSIKKAGLTAQQTFSGVAQSSKEASVSFKVNGTINRIYVKVGDRVRQGQLIAAVDATDYSVQQDQAIAQLKSSETQISSSQAQLVNSHATFERAEKLYENNSVPLSEYQQAKAAYEAAVSQHDAAIAQVAASQAQVTSARNQVDYTRLTAPFSGIINAINAEENEQIVAGNPVAILSAEVQPEVLVGVPEIFIGKVDRSIPVKVQFSNPINKLYDGRITEVGFGSGGGATYPVTVQIIDPDRSIRPGMSANVSFNFGGIQAKQVTLVAPVSAVAEGTSGHFVFKLEKLGPHYQAVKQNVQIGSLLADGFEIKSGLAEGELVATAGLKSLLDGMVIRLLDE